MKKIRIVSRTRFTAFIIILLSGILLFTVSALPADAAKTADRSRHVSCRTVEVQQGDTLWTIAASHADRDQDIRAYIQEICRLNHLRSGGNLTAGQKLRIPDSESTSSSGWFS